MLRSKKTTLLALLDDTINFFNCSTGTIALRIQLKNKPQGIAFNDKLNVVQVHYLDGTVEFYDLNGDFIQICSDVLVSKSSALSQGELFLHKKNNLEKYTLTYLQENKTIYIEKLMEIHSKGLFIDLNSIDSKKYYYDLDAKNNSRIILFFWS